MLVGDCEVYNCLKTEIITWIIEGIVHWVKND